MGNTSKHKKQRALLKKLGQKNSKSRISASSVIGAIDYQNAVNNWRIKNSEFWKDFQDNLQTISTFSDEIKEHLANTYYEDIFDMEVGSNLKGDDYERLTNKVEKMEYSIDRVLSNEESDFEPEVTTEHFFRFIGPYLRIKFCNEEAMKKKFGENIADLCNCTSFKDILSPRYGDKTLEALIAIVLVCEKEYSPFSFALFDKEFVEEAFKDVDFSVSAGEQLEAVLENIRSLSFYQFPVSDEVFYSAIFYTLVNYLKGVESVKYQKVDDVLKKMKVLFGKKYPLLVEKYCQNASDIKELVPSKICDKDLLRDFRNNYKESYNKLKKSYDNLLNYYFSHVSDIVNEINQNDKIEEEVLLREELMDEVREIDSLIEGNNKSNFLSVLNSFNSNDFDENVLKIVFNLALLDDEISEHFIQGYLGKFGSDLMETTTSCDCTLEDVLNRRSINYHYVELLTCLDYNSISKLEYRFYFSLLDLYRNHKTIAESFLNFLVSLNGDNAFTCVADIDKYLGY